MKDSVELKPQEAASDGRKNEAETKTGLDVTVSKKKQGRARASSTGRGRGSKANNDVTKSQPLVSVQLNVSDHKVNVMILHATLLIIIEDFYMSHGFCVLI